MFNSGRILKSLNPRTLVDVSKYGDTPNSHKKRTVAHFIKPFICEMDVVSLSLNKTSFICITTRIDEFTLVYWDVSTDNMVGSTT